MFDGTDRLRLVFVDGVFAPELSDAGVMEGVEIRPLAEVLAMDITWARELFGVLEGRGQDAGGPAARLAQHRAGDARGGDPRHRPGGAADQPRLSPRGGGGGGAGASPDPARPGRRPDALRERAGGGAAERGDRGRGRGRRRLPPRAYPGARPRAAGGDRALRAARAGEPAQVVHPHRQRAADPQRARGRVHRRQGGGACGRGLRRRRRLPPRRHRLRHPRRARLREPAGVQEGAARRRRPGSSRARSW